MNIIEHDRACPLTRPVTCIQTKAVESKLVDRLKACRLHIPAQRSPHITINAHDTPL